MSEPLPRITVLGGGTSPEREVSLGSGRACAIALARSFPTRLVDVTREELPAGLDPDRDVVFSTLHGTFGEDGAMQRLLDLAGVIYAGCDAASSELTFDKERTKQVVRAAGGEVARGWMFAGADKPTVKRVLAELGPQVVIKPNRSGSSVNLHVCDGPSSIEAALAAITDGEWVVEQRIVGRELTVGLIRGRAMGVVEIAPKSGVFDYSSKYTKGLTEYLAPAPLAPEIEQALQRDAETAFAACGCRDYARIDYIMTPENRCFLLEINTLPGMKETSLLPMSAQCAGMDFTALVRELVAGACERFAGRKRIPIVR